MPAKIESSIPHIPTAATEPPLNFKRVLLPALLGSVALLSTDARQIDIASPNYSIGGTAIAEARNPSVQEGDNNKKDCTTVRFDGQYIIKTGKLCAKDGAKASKVGNGYPRFGWILSVVTLDNVVTCGYIKPKILPERKPPSGSISDCKEYRPVMQSRKLIDDPNCGDINGNDSCVSGTWHSPVSEDCSSRGIVYRRFTTKKPSPWNLRGVNTPAFSLPLSETKNTSVSYRGVLRMPGEKRKAIAVMTDDGWGVMPNNCVEKKYRYGGTCKDRKRNRNELGDIVCGSSVRVRSDAKSWRELSEK